MISYVIVDEDERTEFEKNWQVPYGYAMCDLFSSLDDAMDEIELYYGSNWIIEECESGRREIVYRKE